jgi:excinuclease ABC subunit C
MSVVPDSTPAFATSIAELLASNPHIEALRTAIKVTPKCPGVYRFFSPSGDLLYVGKAKDLRNRLLQYVSPGEDASLGPWKRSMIRTMASVEYTVTRSELEALVLETNLIKENKPKYNVLMKDDKNYVYVRISKEFYPEVRIVRLPQKDAAVYFGPFLSMFETRRMLDVFNEIYPYMTAKETVRSMNAKHLKNDRTPLYTTASLSMQIGKHCRLGMPDYHDLEYQNSIEQLQRFLRGERRGVRQVVEEAMRTTAGERKFEKAAKLRDVLSYLTSLEEKQTVSDTSGEDTDFIGISLMRGYSMLVLLRERDGKLIAEQSFSFHGKSEDGNEVLTSFITQYYSQTSDIPAVLVIPFAITDTVVLQEWLQMQRGKSVEIRVPERGKKVSLLELAQTNAAQKVKQLEATFEAEAHARTSALEELQRLLSLPTLPNRIEGYDISHLGGTETVGSMVVMRNGKADNTHYRNFTIHSLVAGAIDDFASLKEVLHRRLLYLCNSVHLEREAIAKQGYEIRKAKKADTQALQALYSEPTAVYNDHVVVEKSGVLCAALRKYTHNAITEIDRYHVPASVPDSIVKSLVQTALQSVKKGKVYVCVEPKMQEFWSAIGAKVIQSYPKALQCTPVHVPMMFEMHKTKEDVSLKSVPDLLVIDGGKGQLSTVYGVLKELQLKIPVIGLAKREEEVFVPGQSLPIEFAKDSPAKFMLMRLRNEAHRFANAHREKRGLKQALKSIHD